VRRRRARGPVGAVSASLARGPVGAVSASLARRRAGREPRVVVRTAAGELRTLAAGDPAARRLLAAAEGLILAAQRPSGP
jgi:hypothetical protein